MEPEGTSCKDKQKTDFCHSTDLQIQDKTSSPSRITNFSHPVLHNLVTFFFFLVTFFFFFFVLDC